MISPKPYRGYTLTPKWGENGIFQVAVIKSGRLFWAETGTNVPMVFAAAKLWVDTEEIYPMAYATTVPPTPP